MFDEPGDPVPLDAETAVRRGEKFVDRIARFFAFTLLLIAILPAVVIGAPTHILVAGYLVAYYGIWVIIFREWRAWSLRSGCSPEELHEEAVFTGFMPERGTFFWYAGWPAYVA